MNKNRINCNTQKLKENIKNNNIVEKTACYATLDASNERRRLLKVGRDNGFKSYRRAGVHHSTDFMRIVEGGRKKKRRGKQNVNIILYTR